jgi:hypothetical protein
LREIFWLKTTSNGQQVETSTKMPKELRSFTKYAFGTISAYICPLGKTALVPCDGCCMDEAYNPKNKEKS